MTKTDLDLIPLFPIDGYYGRPRLSLLPGLLMNKEKCSLTRVLVRSTALSPQGASTQPGSFPDSSFKYAPHLPRWGL